MAFKAMTSSTKAKRLPTAEEFYDDNQEAFNDGDVVMYVHRIAVTPFGYRLHGELCTVFCSFKFWSMAKVLKAYIKGLKNKTVVQNPMIAVNVPNSRGYCDWNFGIDTGKDSKKAKCIFNLTSDREDTGDDYYEFPQTESIISEPDSWCYNSYQPDPQTPSSQVAKADAKAAKGTPNSKA